MPKSRGRKKKKNPHPITIDLLQERMKNAPKVERETESGLRVFAWREIILIIGLLGTVITLVSNVDAFFKVAGWMQFLTAHWREWTHRLWELLGVHVSPFVKNVLTFQVFLIMLTIGSLLRALIKFRRHLRASLPRTQPSPWEVRGNFVLICLGLSVIAIMLAFNSIDLANGYLIGLLIGLAITVMLVPTSWTYNFGLVQIRNRLFQVIFWVAAIIALGLATNFSWIAQYL